MASRPAAFEIRVACASTRRSRSRPSRSPAHRRSFPGRLDVRDGAGFSDAWMADPSTRSDGRRPRSAKARNRGKLAPAAQQSLMGIIIFDSSGVDLLRTLFIVNKHLRSSHHIGLQSGLDHGMHRRINAPCLTQTHDRAAQIIELKTLPLLQVVEHRCLHCRRQGS